MAEVRVTLGHILTLDKERGRNARGGWRHIPMCSCGWNRPRRPWTGDGRAWPSSFATLDGAVEEFEQHRRDERNDRQRAEVRVAKPGQGTQRPFVLLRGP